MGRYIFRYDKFNPYDNDDLMNDICEEMYKHFELLNHQF
jgi:hypothetical protein